MASLARAMNQDSPGSSAYHRQRSRLNSSRRSVDGWTPESDQSENCADDVEELCARIHSRSSLCSSAAGAIALMFPAVAPFLVLGTMDTPLVGNETGFVLPWISGKSATPSANAFEDVSNQALGSDSSASTTGPPPFRGDTASSRGLFGGPSSRGSKEDSAAVLAANRAARHATKLAASDTRPLFWLPIGDGGSNMAINQGVEVYGGAQIPNGKLQQCQDACRTNTGCGSIRFCGGKCQFMSLNLLGSEPSRPNRQCASYFLTADTYRPKDPELLLPSDAPMLSFYIYRAQAPAAATMDYPMANVNAASIGGVMWYLHNEIIRDHRWGGVVGNRKFDISRIRRFKITMKATRPLFKRGMNFGAKCSFDSGECTGPHRDNVDGPKTGWHSLPDWKQYGFNVGCDYLGEYPHTEWIFQSGKKYPHAVWYSLPGPCPTLNFRENNATCRIELPGGLCPSPDGRGNCTYHVEEAGEIDIDALVGITPKWKGRAEFVKKGGFEGDGPFRGGRLISFWNNIYDEKKNAQRTQLALDAFHAKYPDMPKEQELAPPKCDFNRKRYNAK
eukprot:TRINITY_DN9400_c0_g1_i1.p1 TRINITY_DN9400_c0_g1~~TRINITY_DN9400_c0_g1_i1.p1  ORF type:complete len:560 (-),score=75.19 TRINITY_DN9400_c0_g1_i1:869-2548(-)